MHSGSQRNGASWWDKPDLAAKETGADSRRDPIANAVSWLTDCIIEGFAAYANHYYPWQHEDDRRFGEDTVQSGRQEHRFGSPATPSVDADLSGAVVAGGRSTD
jgi:hypothetical protein